MGLCGLRPAAPIQPWALPPPEAAVAVMVGVCGVAPSQSAKRAELGHYGCGSRLAAAGVDVLPLPSRLAAVAANQRASIPYLRALSLTPTEHALMEKQLPSPVVCLCSLLCPLPGATDGCGSTRRRDAAAVMCIPHGATVQLTARPVQVPPEAELRCVPGLRSRPAGQLHSHPFRFVDGRRPRRKSQRHRGGMPSLHLPPAPPRWLPLSQPRVRHQRFVSVLQVATCAVLSLGVCEQAPMCTCCTPGHWQQPQVALSALDVLSGVTDAHRNRYLGSVALSYGSWAHGRGSVAVHSAPATAQHSCGGSHVACCHSFA